MKLLGGVDPPLTYRVSGLKGSDTLGGGLIRDPGEVEGVYAIRQGTLVNSNYTIAFTNGMFSINYAVTIPPLKSPATLGSAVPVSWQLKDAQGNIISSLSTLTLMQSVFNGPAPASGVCVASSVGTVETLYSPATGATGKSGFRFVDTTQSFQFNWDTTTASTTITGKGCYTVLITLNDPLAVRSTTPVLLK